MRLARPAALSVLVALLLTPGAALAVEPLPVTEVASGVFVHQGAHEMAEAESGGDIANLGFVIGNDAVAVIDSGASTEIGRRLRAAVAAQTDLAVRYVILTHMHPDHALGTAPFRQEGAEVLAHADLPRALASRLPTYRARSAEWAAAPAEEDTQLLPTATVEATRSIDLGGRVLRLTAHPTAHTNNDLTVLDEATGTLFAGDLVVMERHPSLDGSILGWGRVLDRLAAIPAERVVPGHGPPSAPWPAAAQPLRDYLDRVVEEVRALQAERVGLTDAVERTVPDAKRAWRLWDVYHPQLVTAAYAELEWE